jgi:hypothetical protein
MAISEGDCGDWTWMQEAQNLAQWQPLVLAVLNGLVLLTQYQITGSLKVPNKMTVTCYLYRVSQKSVKRRPRDGEQTDI